MAFLIPRAALRGFFAIPTTHSTQENLIWYLRGPFGFWL
jgi:hypothetical protein